MTDRQLLVRAAITDLTFRDGRAASTGALTVEAAPPGKAIR